MRFGLALDRLWQDDARPLAQKKAMFARMQLSELRSQPGEIAARSQWQGFDGHDELIRHELSPRDTVVAGSRSLKPINQIVQERMARNPFVPFAKFDTAEFADIGAALYDLNRHVDGVGRDFWYASRNYQNHAKAKRELREAHRKLRIRQAERRRAEVRARRESR